MTPEPEKTPSWKSLLYDYTQETTLHGLRYVTLRSAFVIRKIIWMVVLLGAFSLFVYLVVDKVQHLMSHPKAVNVEIKYNGTMVFPAVTICNANQFKLTKLQESGLYDLMVEVAESKASDVIYPILNEKEDDVCREHYSLHLGICGIPNSAKYSSGVIPSLWDPWLEEIMETSRAVCMSLCFNLYPTACSSILYNTVERSCTLTSYIGSTASEKCANSSHYEYYRKHRCTQDKTVFCTFEHSTSCKLTASQEEIDKWSFERASDVGQPFIDNTLSQRTGSFLYILGRDTGENIRAVMFTEYINTTGMCVKFAYHISGSAQKAHVNVSALTEDKQETVVGTVRQIYTTAPWLLFWNYLPPGNNIVTILGDRGSGGQSELAVDEFENVSYGDEPRIRRGCLLTRAGQEYMGIKNVTSTGQTCLYWKGVESGMASLIETDVPFNHLFPDHTIEEAENFCRSIPPLGSLPGCFVSAEIWAEGSFQTCDLPYCHALKSVDCTFSDPFFCGYRFETDIPYQWYAGDSDDIEGNDPYLLLSSNLGERGSQARMTTPFVEVTSQTNLYFDLYLSSSTNSTMSSLSIYQMEENIQKLLIYSVEEAAPNRWKTYEAALSLGKYTISFEGTMGAPFLSDMAIRNVRTKIETNSEDTVSYAPILTSVECEFDTTEICGYTYKTTTRGFAWSLVPEESLHQLLSGDFEEYLNGSDCRHVNIGLEGSFQSDNYPDNYPEYTCTYFILNSKNASINLVANEFHIEEGAKTCAYDGLEVRILNNNQLQKEKTLCGYLVPETIVGNYQTKTVSMKFYADDYYSFSGFNISYRMTPLPGQAAPGMSLAIPMLNTLPTWTETFKLLSPIYETSGDKYCVDMVLYAGASFTVTLTQISNADENHESLLLRAPFGFGETRHRILMTLPYEHQQMHTHVLSLQAEVSRNSLMTAKSYAAGLDYVNVMKNMTCGDAQSKLAETPYCQFPPEGNGPPVCTMQPASYTTDYAMAVPLTYTTDNSEAIMVTPKLTNTSVDCCLEFKSKLMIGPTHLLTKDPCSVLYGTLSIYDFDNPDGDIFAKFEIFQCNKWIANRVSFSAGVERFAFSFSRTIKATAFDDIPAQVAFFVSDIEVLNTTCVSTDGDTLATYYVPYNYTKSDIVNKTNKTNYNQTEDHLGESVPYYDHLVSLLGGQSMDDVYNKLSHAETDLIFGCSWNGLSSDCIVKKEITDSGACYTFNGDHYGIARESDRTGSVYGLNVLINAEVYEYATVFNQSDIGIKVHLHSQNDEANVLDAGFGVAPGIHALAAVTHSETVSLSPPWGKCADIPLLTNATYSRQRCILECAGNATIETYKIFEKQDLCEPDCPDACHTEDNAISLSSIKMSGDVTRKLIQPNISGIEEKYSMAQNIRHRVESEILDEMLTILIHSQATLAEANAVIRSDIDSEATSVIYRIEDAITMFLDLSKQDIRNVFFNEFDLYVEGYANDSNAMVLTLTDLSDRLIIAMTQLEISLSMKIKGMYIPGAAQQEQYWENLKNNIMEIGTDFYTAYTLYDERDNERENNKVQLKYALPLKQQSLIGEACEHVAVEDIYEDMFEQYDSYNLSTSSKNFDWAPYRATLGKVSQAIPGLIAGRECFIGYKGFLDEVGAWLTELESRPGLQRRSSGFGEDYYEYADEMEAFLEEGFLLYIHNNWSKSDLAKEIETLDLEARMTELSLYVSTFQENTINYLKNSIRTITDDIRDLYIKAMDVEMKFSEYLRDTRFEADLRTSMIWKEPYPRLQSPEIIKNRLSSGQIWQSWPDTMTLSNFAGSRSSRVIDKTTKKFGDELIDFYLGTIELELETSFGNLKSSLGIMNDYFANYLREERVDDTFVSTNFLQLDIFYSELKYSRMEQIKDYNIATLFSEIGGYMGLLLGGSCITLIEFLDLFLYNCFRKATRKKRRNVITVKSNRGE
ncbi:hypothetical protein CAPTEDRAFT_188177 [Capitella teleta]|uniref:CUB domain-containing protein n=1 Tax=Capitella teleta TaxID=283909 RepID=R7TRY2_CAPTE|nr:hypothetical protein CAPTEDRAFT_188177 [Capitella teleta]|eukprot:ELT96394.1 hypothetical protein CAPTEDRAFT_188177 [Capitella teleta]